MWKNVRPVYGAGSPGLVVMGIDSRSTHLLSEKSLMLFFLIVLIPNQKVFQISR